LDLDADRNRVVFVGDSPNDASMFGPFRFFVSVAKLRDFAGRPPAEPAFVAPGRSTSGFCEVAGRLLAGR